MGVESRLIYASGIPYTNGGGGVSVDGLLNNLRGNVLNIYQDNTNASVKNIWREGWGYLPHFLSFPTDW